MANNLSFPGGFGSQPVRFSVGTSDIFSNLVTNNEVDSNRFYVIQQGTQYFLYLGEKPIAAAAPVYDSALSLTSNNAVQNKTVTQGLNNAVEVIKDENIETYQGGKFYYKADNINPSLKFYISSLESIDLLKSAVSVVSTYSDTDETNAISGKGVAEALQTLKLIDVTELPESLENGAFYRIHDEEKDIYALWFITATGSKIELSNPVPVDHSDTDSKYGASTDSKYGHAKSGITITDATATTLSDAYTDSSLDQDLVGSNIDAYARVDHKHPYPSFAKVASTTTTDAEKKAIAEMLLGSANTYAFIQKGEQDYKQTSEQVIISANDRLFALENDYIGSTITDDQSIASNLSIAGNVSINNVSKLIAKTIESPKLDGSYTGLNINGALIAADGLTISSNGLNIVAGNISATNSTLTAKSAVLTGDLTASGNISLGADDGFKLINPANSNDRGTVSTDYNWTFTGDITASSITATNVNASLNGAITSSSANFTGAVTSKAYTISQNGEDYKWNTVLTLYLGSGGSYYLGTDGNAVLYSINTSNFTFKSKTLDNESGGWTTSNTDKTRLVYDSIKILTEQDLLDATGLVNTWLKSHNYASNTTVSQLSDRITNNWDAVDVTKVPTEFAITEYLSINYIPITKMVTTLNTANDEIPTCAAVTTGIQGILTTSISAVNDKAATPGAVQSYISGLTSTTISDSNSTLATPGAVKNYISGLTTTSVSNGSSNLVTSGAVYTFVTSQITVSASQPTGSRAGQLWINTSLGNGVIYYYTGSAWKATSAVWS